MAVIQIELPERLLLGTGQSRDEFVGEAKFLLALKLFEIGRISSGVAAEIAGINRVDFMFRAGQAGVTLLDLDESELEREFEDV